MTVSTPQEGTLAPLDTYIQIISFRFQTLKIIMDVAEISEIFRDQSVILNKFSHSFTSEIVFMNFLLDYMIDFNNARSQKNCAIQNGIDEFLDQREYSLCI